jgi:hypothetical protein
VAKDVTCEHRQALDKVKGIQLRCRLSSHESELVIVP